MPVAMVMGLYRKHSGKEYVETVAAPDGLDVTASRRRSVPRAQRSSFRSSRAPAPSAKARTFHRKTWTSRL